MTDSVLLAVCLYCPGFGSRGIAASAALPRNIQTVLQFLLVAARWGLNPGP